MDDDARVSIEQLKTALIRIQALEQANAALKVECEDARSKLQLESVQLVSELDHLRACEQLREARDEVDELKQQLREACKEADLLKQQLFQAQEELEHYFLLSQAQPQPSNSMSARADHTRDIDEVINSQRSLLLTGI